MTWRRRNRSASAWGSSRVLMIGPGPGGGRRDALPDVLGPLGDAVHGAPGRLEDLPRAGEDLAADEERDQDVGEAGEVALPLDEVVLVAAVGVAGRVGVVLEQVHLTPDALLPQPLLGRHEEALEDPLPRLVVDHHVVDGVALGGGVLGVGADVEVEPGPVLQEDVRRTAPGDHPTEKVAGHLVRAQAPLAPEGAGDAVLVLEAEDPTFHKRSVRPRAFQRGPRHRWSYRSSAPYHEAVDGVNERVRMARLTTVGGSFAARVLQARLVDEGLDGGAPGLRRQPLRLHHGRHEPGRRLRAGARHRTTPSSSCSSPRSTPCSTCPRSGDRPGGAARATGLSGRSSSPSRWCGIVPIVRMAAAASARSASQHPGELVVADPAELPPGPVAVEYGHLELVGCRCHGRRARPAPWPPGGWRRPASRPSAYWARRSSVIASAWPPRTVKPCSSMTVPS